MDATGGWDAQDIPDQSGRSVLITGANSGIGLAAATELARCGATVTLACRSIGKAESALAGIRSEHPEAQVELLELNLSDLSSVRDAAAEFADTHSGLDLLINNAGVMGLPHTTTVDGFEAQFATNHLGHFALTGLLLGQILAKSHSRVVTVSSLVHRVGRIDLADLQRVRRYGPWSAYAQSKLANLLFTYELQRKLMTSGADAISVAAHPGFARTNLQAAGSKRHGAGFSTAVFDFGGRLVGQSPAAGALPTLRAATAPGVAGGDFFGPDGFAEQQGPPVRVRSTQRSHNESVARRLWEISEDLTGVSYREVLDS